MIRELSKEFRMFQFDLAIGKNRGKKEHFMARAFFSCFKPLGESTLALSTHILINLVKNIGKKNAFLSEGHIEVWGGCDRKLVKCTLISTQERLNKADLSSHLAFGDSDAKSVDSNVSSFPRLVHLKHECTCEDSVP